MSHCIRAYLATLAVAAAACDTVPTAPTSVEPPPTVMIPVPSGLVGRYLLTLEIDASCTAVPPAERTRRYDATVARAGDRLVVTLAGASFLAGRECPAGSGPAPGLGCNQFLLNEDLDWVGADLRPRDDVRGGRIVERVSAGGWIEISGHASGGGSDLAEISLEGPAHAWYCTDDVDTPFEAPCAGSRPGSDTVAPPTSRACESSRMRLQFTRRRHAISQPTRDRVAGGSPRRRAWRSACSRPSRARPRRRRRHPHGSKASSGPYAWA